MRILTFRVLFERADIVSVLQGPEFEHNIPADIVKKGNPAHDHYLAVFVFTAESQNDGRLLLRAASTTVVGIQRFTTKRLRYQGIQLFSPKAGDFLGKTLQAHYRAQHEDVLEGLEAIIPNYLISIL